MTRLDEALCRRIEDAGLNASAPREQRWIDGWLVRFAPGKARRARCIQPVAPGRLSIDEKLALCAPVYREAGLPLHVRMTPFAEPAGLDARLERLGFAAVDETLVLARPLDGGADARPAAPTLAMRDVATAPFADWIGAARGSSLDERASHARRLEGSPVPIRAAFAVDADGTTVGCAQYAREGDIVGLYDVWTLESRRGRGLAGWLCASLLAEASARGARLAYLQVDARNAAALTVYRRLGFDDAYAYRYRVPAAPTA